MLVFRLLKYNTNLRALAIVILAGKVNSKFCNGGHTCSPPKECCPLGCCLVFASPGHRPPKSDISENLSSMSGLLFWNHWLFWILLVLLLLVLLCGCGFWKKRQFFSNRFHRRTNRNEEERSEFDSTGSCYPPPQYSRCSSFHYAPPPYAEVTSKPDLYPLVISYKSENGKFGDNCVMVQYFRNYVVHPALGSTGSTMDSVGSSFFSQSIQEIDSNYPPTYEESRIGESNLPVLESSGTESRRGQSTNYHPQRQIFGSGEDNRPGNGERPHIAVDNVFQSARKSSATICEPSNLIANLPGSFKNVKIVQNPSRSVSGVTEPAKKPRHMRVSNFNRIHKPFLLSVSADSITGNVHPSHQYTPDVILAQPKSYCDSNNDLHYDSFDILTNPDPFLLPATGSCSSEDNLSQPRGSIQDFVSSDGISHSQFSNPETNNFSTGSEVSSLLGCGSPDSPPRAISPTGEFRNLLEKIQELPKRKYGGSSHFESNHFDVLNNDDDRFRRSSGKLENFSEPEEESGENMEKVSLLNDSVPVSKCKSRKLTRPNELPGGKILPRKSKTFHISFCNHNSVAVSKRNNSNFKSSTSAPVTPINNFPSSSSMSFNFNSNKLGSKKNLEIKSDGKFLLRDEEGDESCDELF